MDNIKRIRVFLLIFIVSLLLLAIYYVKLKQSETSKPGIKIERVESGIENFHLIEQTSNRLSWELWADKADITNQEQVSDLTSPRVKVYLEQVKTPVEITSQKGNFNSISKTITLTDDVVAISGETVIKTDTVQWNSEEEVLKTEAPVFVTAPKFKVEGVGMRAYITKEKVELLSKVQGEIVLDRLPGPQKEE